METSKTISRKFGTVIQLFWNDDILFYTDDNLCWSYSVDDAVVFDTLTKSSDKIKELAENHNEWQGRMYVISESIRSEVEKSSELKMSNKTSQIVNEMLNSKIVEWHNGNYSVSLPEYLGMTDNQYKHWVETGRLLDEKA